MIVHFMAKVHLHFVDGFIKKNYLGKEEEIFEKLSKNTTHWSYGKATRNSRFGIVFIHDEAGVYYRFRLWN